MSTMPLPVEEDNPPPGAIRWTRSRRAALAVTVLLVLAGGTWVAMRTLRARQAAVVAAQPRAPDPTTDSLARAPAGVRIKVAVVNATKIRGLARRATQALRDRGYDVVEIGTTAQLRDSSLVLDRSGHPDWGRRISRALGGARVEARPDSSHYLDLTVFVGRAWHPPAEPLYP